MANSGALDKHSLAFDIEALYIGRLSGKRWSN